MATFLVSRGFSARFIVGAIVTVALGATCVAEINDDSAGVEKPPEQPTRDPVFVFMLANGAVQDEIGLSAQQKARIAEMHHALVQDAHNAFAETPTPSTPTANDKAKAPSLGTCLQQCATELAGQFEGILSTEQFVRLRQLRLRAQGVWGILDPSVLQTIKLSEETCMKARAAIKASEEKCQGVVAEYRSGKISVTEAIPRVDELRFETYQEVRSLLSLEQSAAYERLLGPEPQFDPSKLRYGIPLVP